VLFAAYALADNREQRIGLRDIGIDIASRQERHRCTKFNAEFRSKKKKKKKKKKIRSIDLNNQISLFDLQSIFKI
jgi:hypothetical protein